MKCSTTHCKKHILHYFIYCHYCHRCMTVISSFSLCLSLSHSLSQKLFHTHIVSHIHTLSHTHTLSLYLSHTHSNRDTYAVIMYWDSDVSDIGEYRMNVDEIAVIREAYKFVSHPYIIHFITSLPPFHYHFIKS